MAIFVPIDDALVENARTLGRHGSRRAVVTAALREYIERRQRAQSMEVHGDFPHDPESDYRTLRYNTGEGTA